MTVLRVDTLAGIGSTGAGTVLDGSFSFTSQNYVILPKGTTNDRVGVGSTAGALRYNTDSNKVELWDGSQWVEVQSSRPDLNGGARGLFGGGQSANTNTIDYITISSTGNATDFGDLTQARLSPEAVASSTRGVIMGGYPYPGATVGTIETVTIASTGNAVDSNFDLSAGRTYFSALSNSTRGISAGGDPSGAGLSTLNILEYITIASLGNAVDFGDLTQARKYCASCASPTRGVTAGGSTPSATNIIDFITISTLGNSTDFGDLTQARENLFSCSNPIRGLFSAGYVAPGSSNTIDYITISTIGNATDFGDLTVAREGGSACSSSTRGVFADGTVTPTGNVNVIDYVTIATQGNAVDFGDRTEAKNKIFGCSNAHGGL